tara:strand:- start:1485 stop:2975 length:1491 start_codon:yes stop_codon:yes gene_type:complete
MLKKWIAKIIAFVVVKRIEKTYSKAAKIQKKILLKLIKKASNTLFGLDHSFSQINNYKTFKRLVPVTDYEGIKSYIDKVKNAEENVLWPGKPRYFAKTSGTTSGAKLIPISNESMPHHIRSSRNALLFYINKTGKADFLNGKTIFIQGSPVLENINGIKTGRLSGIVAHYVPSYLRSNNMPSWDTNCIDDWEQKINLICDETLNEDMTVIGGIPSWVQMYFEKLITKSNKKTLSEIFKNFSLFVFGGVNFEPYKKKFSKLIGKKVDSIEYFPASEGFFAYQNNQNDKALLLQYDSGIFYEFIKLVEFESDKVTRHDLSTVEIGVNYVMIISTNAGLWAYNTGDTVIFTSLVPPKILVTGRYKHFISAFGEHVIASEVEESLAETVSFFNVVVSEFTVAPKLENKDNLPCHEWCIEIETTDFNKSNFSKYLNSALCNRNIYYRDLIEGKVLKELEIVVVKKGTFNNYMKSKGKLGGQNKIPRLSNNRELIEGVLNES